MASGHSNQAQPTRQTGDCNVREATLADYGAIREASLRNGIGAPNYLDWERFWKDTPFRSGLSAPLGWVLEEKSQGIVGTFSSVPRIYTYNGEPVRVALARGWAVDPSFRSASIFLANKFFSQKNVDLFLDTTASPQAGAIFKAFKCKEIPGPSCAQVLFWIINYAGFAGSVLRRKQIPHLAALRHVAGPALCCMDLLHRRKARRQQGKVCLLHSFDERFDAFWDVLRRRQGRLLAVRSSAALTWQFRPALESGDVVILAMFEGESLSGYLVMKRYDQEKIGLRRFRIVDIQAVSDEADTVLSLVSAALEHAAQSGVDVLEAMGFNRSKRDLLERFHPHRRMLPACPYLYRVSEDSRSLRNALQEADAWDPSPFDGDAAL
jgi:hypothetical protein